MLRVYTKTISLSYTKAKKKKKLYMQPTALLHYVYVQYSKIFAPRFVIKNTFSIY